MPLNKNTLDMVQIINNGVVFAFVVKEISS